MPDKKEQQERLRNLVSHSPGIFFSLTGPDMIIDFVNETLLVSAARDREIVGKPFREAFPELIDQPFPARLQQVYESGEAYMGSEEKAVILKNGEPIDAWYNYIYQPVFDNDGNVTGITVMAADITEQVVARNKMEESKKESDRQKRLYEAITGSTPDLIYIFDLRYRFIYANEALLQMWGSNWDNSIGKSLLENGYEPWHAEMHEREIDQVVATKKSVRGEVSFAHATLGSRIYDYILVPVFNTNGEVEAVAGTTRDITDLKRAEDAVRKSETRLEHLVAERTRELKRSNEDLQQFAHVASHDLKEPARKVRLFTDRLRQEFGSTLPKKADMYLEKIQSAAERMYAMIEGVLTYSAFNSTTLNVESVDLNDVLRNVENDLEIIFQQKNARIASANLPVIRSSPSLVYQLFYNLVNNSLKFSKADVPPVITVSADQITMNEGEFIKVQLKDNGIGFEQAYAQQIFRTFARLQPREQYEGTGLGLSLCKNIMERIGGEIYAEGKTGEGATMTMLFPNNHNDQRTT